MEYGKLSRNQMDYKWGDEYSFREDRKAIASVDPRALSIYVLEKKQRSWIHKIRMNGVARLYNHWVIRAINISKTV